MYTNNESRLYAEQKERETKAGTRFSEKEARAEKSLTVHEAEEESNETSD